MQTIGQATLRSLCPESGKMIARKCEQVRKHDAVLVTDFLDLAEKVAQLQYENREHIFMFRGQSDDYRNNKGNTTIKPRIFRGRPSNRRGKELEMRFQRLRIAEESLVSAYADEDLPRKKEIGRRQVLRWAILQHYELCDTPLLDVTHSLRVAASFASDHDANDGYIFVLGVPNIAGAITTSVEAELQILRLASICPPIAMRPHIQEGYVLGEYPDIANYEQKMLYRDYEVDFGLRLTAKFKFRKTSFWKSGDFSCIPRSALYPNAADEFMAVAEEVEKRMGA